MILRLNTDYLRKYNEITTLCNGNATFAVRYKQILFKPAALQNTIYACQMSKKRQILEHLKLYSKITLKFVRHPLIVSEWKTMLVIL
jgi:hypothetical protein